MRKTNKQMLSWFVVLCVVWSLFPQAPARAVNLMVNGGFEAQALQWEVINPASGSWAYDGYALKEGSRSLRLTPTDSEYPHLLALQQYYDNLTGSYFFEGYTRIDDLYNGAYRPCIAINIVPKTAGAFSSTYKTFSMPSDAPRNTWIKLRGVFDVPADARVFIQIFANGDSQGSPGNAWFDALVLSKYDSPNTPRKKVIQYGADAPDTRYVRQHWQEMERMPLDGIGINVAIDRTLPSTGAGASANLLGWHIFGSTPLQLQNFRPAIDDLQSAQWHTFSDNFLPVAIASYDQDQGFTWFDDTRWNTILNNWSVLVSIAKQGGCKGLIFDPEHYDYSGVGAELFSFQEQYNERDNTHNFAAYKAKVRERGRQLMIASGQLYPDMTMLCTYAYYPASLEGNKPEEQRRYALLGSFMDGMLEGSHANTKWVDMCEQAYGYKERQQFQEAYNYVHAGLVNYSAVPAIYSSRMQAGFGLWLDNGNHWSTADFSQNYFTPDAFRQSLQNALDVSDEYVWIYTQTPAFFARANLPDAYINAIGEGRAAAGETQNLIRNGSFEPGLLSWDIVNPTKGQSLSSGEAALGAASLRLSPTGSAYPTCYAFQQYSDTVKSQYFFEGYIRINNQYNGPDRPRICLNVYPKTAGDFSPVIETFDLPGGAPFDTWVRVGGTVDVPPNARVWTQLFVTGTAGSAWFDGLSLR